MAKTLKDLWGEADKLNAEGEKVAEAKATAAKLPYTLKDEFRQRQDPELDKAINKAESDTFGAAIHGLNLYQDITNPFARRDLAENYQGIVSQGYKNLTDERTRRQGVYADYIEKWTGLFGAEAARQSDIFQNKLATFDREKNLADTEENNRRWEIENARAERSAARTNSKFTDEEVTSTINTLKNNGTDWETIAKYLGEKGIDVSTGSYADVQLNTAFKSGNYPLKPSASSSLSPNEELAKIKLDQARKDEEIKRKADAGEDGLYWSGTNVKKKQKRFGIDWFKADTTEFRGN